MKKLLQIHSLLSACFLLSSSVSAQWNPDKSINNVIADTVGRQEFSHICSDGAGGAIMAWYDSRSSPFNDFHDVFVQHINSNGIVQWAPKGISLNVNTTGYGDMDIVADGNGGAVIVFIAGSGSSLNIYGQRVNANGAKLWNSGNPITICGAAGGQYVPKVVNAGDGTFVVVWQDERSGTTTDDIYAQKLNGDGAPQWTVDGVVVNAAVNNQEEPQIVSIGAGEVISCWKDNRSGTNFDIYAQRLNAAGVRQWKGLDNLLSGRVISDTTANQNIPRMCSDGNGGAIIAWQDFRNGATNSTDIYAQRVSGTGVVQWTSNGVVLCNTTNVQEIENIAFVGDGAVVSWIDYASASTDADLYTQKVNLAGTPQWTANGVIVCNEANQQNNSQLTSDSSNGAIYVWTDNRTGSTDRTIYAQRINSSGVAQWQTNGIIVTTAVNGKYGPQIINNGCNSIISWEDGRNSNTVSGTVQINMYATAFDCSGNILSSNTTCTWIGAVSTDWMNNNNWSCGAVPSAVNDVIIPASTPFSLTIVAGSSVFCKSMTVNSGAIVTVAAGANIKTGQ